jgi:hypothetical protein
MVRLGAIDSQWLDGASLSKWPGGGNKLKLIKPAELWCKLTHPLEQFRHGCCWRSIALLRLCASTSQVGLKRWDAF